MSGRCQFCRLLEMYDRELLLFILDHCGWKFIHARHAEMDEAIRLGRGLSAEERAHLVGIFVRVWPIPTKRVRGCESCVWRQTRMEPVQQEATSNGQA